jgi:hypothetical protein
MTTIEKCIKDALEKLEECKVKTEIGIDMIPLVDAKRIISDAIQCTEVEIINEPKINY